MRSLLSDETSDELNSLQIKVTLAQIPVAVIFEGSSGRVISRVVNEICRDLEPMGINYYHFDAAEKGSEPLAELLNATPGKGEITLYDRSWYSLLVDRYNDDEDFLKDSVSAINSFEEYLLDNGTYIIKIFLDATFGDLRKYAEDYRPYTPFNNTFLSVDRIDRVKFNAVFPKVLKESDTDRAPWETVDVEDVESTMEETAKVLIKHLKDCLGSDWNHPGKHSIRTVFPNPRKGLDPNAEADDYNDRMDAVSSELERLQILLSESDRSLVLAFEGWDAAGKGGAIKHLCHALNPRGYDVARVKKPTDEDYAHTHLWRFARFLPGAGHIAIFDRTWYGRMMVEPIEGFCDEVQYSRSADELNAFENILHSSGAIIIKFWLEIDKDTQLERFNDRKDDPLKQWKLTDEDWRNRDKWDIYVKYVDAMISSTNTPYAPWVVVPANNKKAARLTVLQTVVDVLHSELEKNRSRCASRPT